MRGPGMGSKRNSIFSSLSRQKRQLSQKKLEVVKGKVRGMTPTLHNQSTISLHSQSSQMIRMPKIVKKVSIIDFLSKSEQESKKTISYDNTNAATLNLKISINPQQEPGKYSRSLAQSQFQKYQEQSRSKPVKLGNLKLRRQDSSNILETQRLLGDLGASTTKYEQVSILERDQSIQSIVIQETSMISSSTI